MTQKTREPRRLVYRPARMRVDGEWSDITICNVSSRGFMAKCASPPQRGAYIEVRHRSLCIVARVMWSRDLRFGVRAQDKIDIGLLLAEDPSKPRFFSGEDRRSGPRNRLTVPPPRRPDAQATAEASRRFGRAFEWITLSLAVAMAAVLAFELVATSLNRPMQQVRDAIGRSNQLG